MMATHADPTTYDVARGRLETYFDRTARDAWERLTSDAPVSRIRATVREGRDRMRANLLGWLPDDLRGARLLDAGCGTGALAVEAARRGADVVAIDVAAGLIDIARERAAQDLGQGSIDWRVGDMLDPALGHFDFAVAMDSLIHYRAADIVTAVATLAERTHAAIAFTFAPRTPALSVMHAVGKLFPRGDRAPAIVPVTETHLHAALGDALWVRGWGAGRSRRVSGGFYTSHALELVRP
jgi:magnesium-protoporphyrin O-methyltransferase